MRVVAPTATFMSPVPSVKAPVGYPDVMKVRVPTVPLQVPLSVAVLQPLKTTAHLVGVMVGVVVEVKVRVKVEVGTGEPPEGTFTSTMEAIGTVTLKLAPVVMELPVPGMEETAGLKVPLMVTPRCCSMGVVPLDFVVPPG